MPVDAFKIYTEQLRDGRVETITETFASDFLDVNEEDLTFTKPVLVEGEVYLAGEDLILHFEIKTFANIPCLICNDKVLVEVYVPNFYHAEPLEQIKHAVFDFRELIREAILLETPSFAECNGMCSKRKEIKKYLKESGKDEGYRPFADLK